MSLFGDYRLECKIKNQFAALERVLRVIRVRGFEVVALDIMVENNMHVGSIRLRGKKGLANLLQHLLKLEDVVFLQGSDSAPTEPDSLGAEAYNVALVPLRSVCL